MGRIKITAIKRGLGKQKPSEDGNSILIGHGYAISGGVQLNTDYLLQRIEDAEDLGITKANDIAQKMLVWYHISEYFRKAPGTKLWIKVLATTVTMANMVDKAQNYLKKSTKDLNGKPRNIGVFINKTSVQQAAVTLTTGLDADVLAAITKATEFWSYEQNLNRPPYCIVLEGREFNGGSTAALDLRTLEAIGVSVTIAQDNDVSAWDALFAKHAAVGTVLGLKAGRSVETNIGEVEGNDIIDKSAGRWLNPGLSSGQKLTAYNDDPDTGDFKVLGEKGYIFPEVAGSKVVMNDDNTCDASDSDFYCMANTAVYAKAHREIYANLLNEKNKKVRVDPATGEIAPGDCARFENQGNKVIGTPEGEMFRANEISGGKTYCDPAQDVVTTSNVELQFEVVPFGYARSITGVIKFSKSLSK